MPRIDESNPRYHRLQILKASSPIGIFGSFFRLEALTAIRDHLNASGYQARISMDLGNEMASASDPDIYNYTQSKRLVHESAIHIFHLFGPQAGASEINQSAYLELAELLSLCREQSRPSRIRSCALLLVEEGVELRSPLQGALRSSACSWEHDFFTDAAATHRTVRKFCFNALHRQPGWENL